MKVHIKEEGHTEDQLDLLTKLGDEFWTEFGQLVAAKLKKAPPELHDLFLMQMQDAASVYGSNYEKYLNMAGPATCQN